MKKYQTVEEHVVVKKHDELTAIICDRCGNEVESEVYDVFSAEYKCLSGSHYPEGRMVEETTMDLCQFCSGELELLLKSKGYKLNVRDDDTA